MKIHIISSSSLALSKHAVLHSSFWLQMYFFKSGTWKNFHVEEKVRNQKGNNRSIFFGAERTFGPKDWRGTTQPCNSSSSKKEAVEVSMVAAWSSWCTHAACISQPRTMATTQPRRDRKRGGKLTNHNNALLKPPQGAPERAAENYLFFLFHLARRLVFALVLLSSPSIIVQPPRVVVVWFSWFCWWFFLYCNIRRVVGHKKGQRRGGEENNQEKRPRMRPPLAWCVYRLRL